MSRSRPALIAPAFNCARYLDELVTRLSACYPLRDILIVDDGSLDDTGEILARRRVRHLTHAQNRGKGAALRSGYHWARTGAYRAAISMDCDLQHAPEDLRALLVAHRRSPDAIVIGSRMSDPRGMPVLRRLTNNLTSLIISIFSHQRIRDSQSGFRLLPLRALDCARVGDPGFAFESELLLQSAALGVKVRETPIGVFYTGAVSNIQPLRDTLRFVALIWRRLWY